VRAFLRSRGFALIDDPRYAGDIERLRIATRSLLDSQQTALVIQAPDGTVEIERSIIELLRNSTGAVALTGDAGSGKSAAANKLARELLEHGQDVVYLTVDSFSPEIVALRGLTFTTSLSETLVNWDGDGTRTLVIDGVDARSWNHERRMGPQSVADTPRDEVANRRNSPNLRLAQWSAVAPCISR
jgi:hypothetical protein